MTLVPEYVEWTRIAISALRIGGFLFIPRSRTKVERTGQTTVRIHPGLTDELLLPLYLKAAGFTIEEPV